MSDQAISAQRSRQCDTCPFGDKEGLNPHAEEAIALGCVPETFEIMQYKRDHDLNWGCHSAEEGETRACSGFVIECLETDIPLTGRHFSYDEWYLRGVPGQ